MTEAFYYTMTWIMLIETVLLMFSGAVIGYLLSPDYINKCKIAGIKALADCEKMLNSRFQGKKP